MAMPERGTLKPRCSNRSSTDLWHPRYVVWGRRGVDVVDVVADVASLTFHPIVRHFSRRAFSPP